MSTDPTDQSKSQPGLTQSEPIGTTPTKEYAIGLFKGAIGAIPFAGAAINETLFEARSRLKMARLTELVEELAHDVGKLKESDVDHEFLRSEEFSDLIEGVLLQASRTRSDDKRRRLRGVLVDAVKGKYDANFTDLFLSLMDPLTDPELVVLRGFAPFAERKAHDPTIEAGQIEYKDGLWGLGASAAKEVVQALVSKGLLVDVSFGRYGAEAFSFVEPTELGVRFLRWLQG